MTNQVISAADVKLWCRIDTDADDAIINLLISTAQDAAASITGLVLEPTTCPAGVKSAIAVFVADLYANREGQTKGYACFERLLAPHRVNVL